MTVGRRSISARVSVDGRKSTTGRYGANNQPVSSVSSLQDEIAIQREALLEAQLELNKAVKEERDKESMN